MDTAEKLGILAAAAKYDASCSTSGSARSNVATTSGGPGIGSCAVGGICHSWAADGRCIALLKVLLSNACGWDCAYCANRRSADARRATFEPEELVRLVMDFYRRNYIEGVLLSSGVLGSPDATMERLVAVARLLRRREHFNGYLHLKAIPGASDALVVEAARLADRVSVNIELPSAASLSRVAPDKSAAAIFGPMRTLARASGFEPRRLVGPEGKGPEGIAADLLARPAIGESGFKAPEPSPLFDGPEPPRIERSYGLEGGSTGPSVREARRSRRRDAEAAMLPAGQTTQLVVGASPESDAQILLLAENLYLAYDVRRVYYSAFIPTGPDPRVPVVAAPPLLREHRLYQADWLFRFYGYTAAEVFAGGSPFLDLDLDPKSAWALRNPAFFPLDPNVASYAELLRVPGIGPVSASRILRARRGGRLRAENLRGLGVVTRRALPFLELRVPSLDSGSALGLLDDLAKLRALLVDPATRRRVEAFQTRMGVRDTQFEFDFAAAAS